MATDYLQYVPGGSLAQGLGLDPKANADIAVQGAKDAQAQANALSTLQWQRQMAGLGQAQGFVNNLQSLYNSIYSPGGGAPAPGGQPLPQMPGSEMDKLSGADLGKVSAPPVSGGGGSALGSIASLTPPGLLLNLVNSNPRLHEANQRIKDTFITKPLDKLRSIF